MRLARRVPRLAMPGALLPPAAFAVHQLRYMLAYGAGSGRELERTGHSYLHSVVPWLVMLLALATGGFLRRVGRAFSGHRSLRRYGISFVALWMLCTGALVAIFAGQELLEGWFAVGHPAGVSGIFAYGGWWAVPAAACIGLVLAAAFHGARRIVDAVAGRALPHRLARLREAPSPRSTRSFALIPAPLQAGWSTRGPPVRARSRLISWMSRRDLADVI